MGDSDLPAVADGSAHHCSVGAVAAKKVAYIKYKFWRGNIYKIKILLWVCDGGCHFGRWGEVQNIYLDGNWYGIYKWRRAEPAPRSFFGVGVG